MNLGEVAADVRIIGEVFDDEVRVFHEEFGCGRRESRDLNDIGAGSQRRKSREIGGALILPASADDEDATAGAFVRVVRLFRNYREIPATREEFSRGGYPYIADADFVIRHRLMRHRTPRHSIPRHIFGRGCPL